MTYIQNLHNLHALLESLIEQSVLTPVIRDDTLCYCDCPSQIKPGDVLLSIERVRRIHKAEEAELERLSSLKA